MRPALKNPLLVLFSLCTLVGAAPVSLFDGKTLAGWEIPDSQKKWWKVDDGKIIGGSLEEKVPLNTFLSTEKSYADFELRFKVKLTQGKDFANSGIQVRSTRKGTSMSGYQVDAGIGYWGTIWDEHRRNKVIAHPVDKAALLPNVKDWDWNDYRILCEGPRIRTWINGILAIDYMEKDPDIPLDGFIGLQAHKGGTFLVEFKDLTIDAFPTKTKTGNLSPAEQQSLFVLPEGFEIELVSSEEQGTEKPVTVTWDSAGRMWTMTAREYPVDANENRAQAEALFERGGRDEVLIFDNPYGPGPHTPRVFADGLVIPLGILPSTEGALVQYGPEIRHYIDADKDGKAEKFETILQGFGIEDSHLFPHQFEYAPGGWVYVAQGLFNRSKVRRPDGKPFVGGAREITFDQCKLARFRTDGSDFELLTAGPNNIWGFGTDRDGETFLQEANDQGIPVAEFLPGTHYGTGSKEKLRTYAPQIPASFKGLVMGGTGLSGIAIANDRDSEFSAKYDERRTFYIANPITNRIQVVTMAQDARGRPTYSKEEDFITTPDTRFRPVAIHFGPDGNLYIVDWYNKIISHNEVPRAHPDRDKTRGRIWRIKPKGQTTPRVPDLAKMELDEVIAALDHPVSLVTKLAWKEIGGRADMSAVPKLTAIAGDATLQLHHRIAAFWALVELGALDQGLLSRCAADPERHIRYEAVRAAGDVKGLDPADFAKLIQPGETDFRVRSIAATAVRRRHDATPGMLTTLLPFIAPKSHGETERERYESDFLRYQIRWAFETHREATLEILKSPDLSPEARSLAMLSLPPQEAATALLEMLPGLDRSLNAEELELLGGQLKQPAVAAAFSELLSKEETRKTTLRNLLGFDVSTASNETLRRAVANAASELSDEDSSLTLDLARRFRLKELIPAVLRMSASGKISTASALKTLNEIGGVESIHFEKFLEDPDSEIRREAVIGFSASAGTADMEKLAGIWPGLPGILRELATNGILRNKENAEVLVLAVVDGNFKDLGTAATERAVSLLGSGHPAVLKLLESSENLLMPVISFSGKPNGKVALNIDLKGPFTLETWIRLDEPVDNGDSLLGKKGVADFNFHNGSPRFHAEGKNRIVASRPVESGIWSHVAFTRDKDGHLRIFLDGEPDPASGEPYTANLTGLNPGVSIAKNGTSAKFLSYRIWNYARSEAEIRETYKTRFLDGKTPTGMQINLPDESRNPALEGGATISMAADFPALRTPAEAAAIAEKFRNTKAKATLPGDTERGAKLAEATCMICHQINGSGQAIGPDLSGAGAMGMDALLHNILLPNEQLESGYYRHDVTLKDGSLVTGFLSSENKKQLVLRQIGVADRVIPRSRISAHKVSKRSLMPEGLIDGFSDQQIADLFAYLMTLK